MSEPTSDPLFLIYPVGFENEASFYGDDSGSFNSSLGFNDPDWYKPNTEYIDMLITGQFVKPVSLEIWCQWKYNSKKFTIDAGSIRSTDGEYEYGLNTYEWGVDPEVFIGRPVPDFRFIDGGIIPSGARHLRHKYLEFIDFEPYTGDPIFGDEVTIWRKWDAPAPFNFNVLWMFIHKGQPYLGFVSPNTSFSPFDSLEITANSMVGSLSGAGTVTVTVTVNLVETYY